ncbi:CMF_collapsed_G0045260.mRNA.1.CDS.1 [Saccharomyces cerevisiae]|nr:CMF_collapsed_G0045260.mRNA.1.CDS.1 [Saccharomyces cerevisiae]
MKTSTHVSLQYLFAAQQKTVANTQHVLNLVKSMALSPKDLYEGSYLILRLRQKMEFSVDY